MSLYNMMFGKNPLSDVLLRIINLTQDDCGRFRDVSLTEEGNIIVYTRNGGGNRDCWDLGSSDSGLFEVSKDCDCPGCVITHKLPNHPNYIKDYDDDFDCTYAYIEFSPPEEFRELFKELGSGKDPELVGEKFNKLIANYKQFKSVIEEV